MRVTAQDGKWAGAELNRRHADFQTLQATRKSSGITREFRIGASLRAIRFQPVSVFRRLFRDSSATRTATRILRLGIDHPKSQRLW